MNRLVLLGVATTGALIGALIGFGAAWLFLPRYDDEKPQAETKRSVLQASTPITIDEVRGMDSLANVVPKGHRAVTFPTLPTGPGLVLPGHYVDVIAAKQGGQSDRRVSSHTLVLMVRSSDIVDALGEKDPRVWVTVAISVHDLERVAAETVGSVVYLEKARCTDD